MKKIFTISVCLMIGVINSANACELIGRGNANDNLDCSEHLTQVFLNEAKAPDPIKVKDVFYGPGRSLYVHDDATISVQVDQGLSTISGNLCLMYFRKDLIKWVSRMLLKSDNGMFVDCRSKKMEFTSDAAISKSTTKTSGDFYAVKEWNGFLISWYGDEKEYGDPIEMKKFVALRNL